MLPVYVRVRLMGTLLELNKDWLIEFYIFGIEASCSYARAEIELWCDVKVILCGDYGVGKTSLFRRFIDDDFHSDDADAAKSSVLGMDFSTREFDVGDRCSVKVGMTVQSP